MKFRISFAFSTVDQALFLDTFSVVFSTLLHARLNNVTDDPRYSRLLTDFSSVGGNVILMVRLLEKRSLGLFGLLRGLREPKKSKLTFSFENKPVKI